MATYSNECSHFVLLSHPRTGSNFVHSALRSSSKVQMYHELFADHVRVIGEDFDRILRRYLAPPAPSIDTVGFKLFYRHLTDHEWNRIHALARLRYIRLIRRNPLRSIVSLAIAIKTDQWTLTPWDAEPKDKRVALDTANLVKGLDSVSAWERWFELEFHDREILTICYEDVVLDPRREFLRIENFLGVDDIDPNQIALRRQNPEPLSDLVSNFDEVRAVLADSKYEKFLFE
ncbi:MAG: sulfotransferase [Arenicellales bacterium]